MTPWFISYCWKDATTHCLPATTGRRLRPPCLSAATERMLQHPIYKIPLEGIYNPLVGIYPTLAPPYHPNMFLSDFHIFLCLQFYHWFLITPWSLFFATVATWIWIAETHTSSQTSIYK